MSFNQKGSPSLGRRKLDELATSTNTKFGSHVALPLGMAGVARVLKLPFGIFELDWYTGGGLPLNRVTRIFGKPSSLKTTTCLKVTRNGQGYCRHCKLPLVFNPFTKVVDCACPSPRWTLIDPSQFSALSKDAGIAIQYGRLPKGVKKKSPGFMGVGENGKKIKVEFEPTNRCEPFRCLIIDTEGTCDEAWAKANGVDTSLLLLVGGNWAEQVLELTEDIILSHEVDLVIIDSLDMLTPGDTLSKALSQTPKVAEKASIMTRCMQKWTSAINSGGLLNRYTPTIVIVAQVRSKHIGKPWASLGPSGGWAIGHGISLDIRLDPKKYEYKGNSALFGTFGCKIEKSKVGGFPKAVGKFRYWLRPGEGKMVGDTEDLETVLEHAVEHKFILKDKGWVLTSDFLDQKVVTFKKKGDLVAFLKSNQSVYTDLRARVLSFLIGEDIAITLPSAKITHQEKIAEKKKKMLTVKQVKEMKKKKKKETFKKFENKSGPKDEFMHLAP